MNRAYERLVDPLCGVITEVIAYPPMPGDPPAYRAFTARVARTARVGPWLADPSSLGSTFDNPRAAWESAVGEAVERYCGNFVPAARLRRATYAALRRAGRDALDPADCVLFSPRQYAQPRFPVVPFGADLPVLWTEADELGAARRILVPASMVWVNFWDGPRAAEPKTNFVSFPGLAAGPDRAAAEESAACELIERDTVALWWHAGVPAPRVDLRHPRLTAALAGADPSLEFVVLALPNRFGLPVCVAIVDEPTAGFACLGSACRPDPVSAALKALAEAIHLRRMFHDLLDPAGRHWQAVARGDIHPALTRPYRADRCYLDDFRADFSDLLDLSQQALVHLDPRMRPRWQRLLARRTAAGMVAPAEIPAIHRGALAALNADGRQVLSVDLTTADIALVGLSVVRVLAPGLIPNTPAGIPNLGTARLTQEPVERGWLAGPLCEDGLERAPMPHV